MEEGASVAGEVEPATSRVDREMLDRVDREMLALKVRIESSSGLETLKISLLASLAVITQRFQSLISRLERIEKANSAAAAARKEKMKERKKVTKLDIGGPVHDTFVHVSGMGMKDGEMTRVDNRHQLDPVLKKFLAQAGFDPDNLGPEDIEKAKEFAEKENLSHIYSEAKEKKSRRKSRQPHSPREDTAGRLETEVRDCKQRLEEVEEQLRQRDMEGEDMRERLVWLEGQQASLSSPLARHSTL